MSRLCLQKCFVFNRPQIRYIIHGTLTLETSLDVVQTLCPIARQKCFARLVNCRNALNWYHDRQTTTMLLLNTKNKFNTMTVTPTDLALSIFPFLFVMCYDFWLIAIGVQVLSCYFKFFCRFSILVACLVRTSLRIIVLGCAR